MSDLTLVSGNEVALLRMRDGSRILRMGSVSNVPMGKDVRLIIAHTHPSGRSSLSKLDIRALLIRGQRSTVIIDPRVDIGFRHLVPGY